jgi:hypothetical protein
MSLAISQARISPGDLLFWKGGNLFSQAIERRTNSEYSHVAIVIPTREGDGTVWDVIEAVAIHGVRQFPLDRYLRDYPGEQVDWFRLDANALERWKLIRFCRRRIGDGYATPRQMSRSFGWLGPWLKKTFCLPTDDNPERQFCSELVSAGLEAAGLAIPKEPALMSPQDVAELSYVSFQDAVVAE